MNHGINVRVNQFLPTWKDKIEPSMAVYMWTRAKKKTRGPCPWPRERVLYQMGGEIHVSPENFEWMAKGRL